MSETRYEISIVPGKKASSPVGYVVHIWGDSTVGNAQRVLKQSCKRNKMVLTQKQIDTVGYHVHEGTFKLSTLRSPKVKVGDLKKGAVYAWADEVEKLRARFEKKGGDVARSLRGLLKTVTK